uniref:Uncharacterized protein n=1 Tax=Trichuris muris TaxID=70415 RepID=A0A5S6QHC7_TRIMR
MKTYMADCSWNKRSSIAEVMRGLRLSYCTSEGILILTTDVKGCLLDGNLQHFQELEKTFRCSATAVRCGFTTMIRNIWNKADNGSARILQGQSDHVRNPDPAGFWSPSFGTRRECRSNWERCREILSHGIPLLQDHPLVH